jgi:DNA-directed RNA polymerase subunit RPC12/RpoP
VPEIEIKIKVYICYRCGHLWEKRWKTGSDSPLACPNCNSPYWDKIPKRGKYDKKKLLPLRFHGEEVLDSNFEEVFAKE